MRTRPVPAALAKPVPGPLRVLTLRPVRLPPAIGFISRSLLGVPNTRPIARTGRVAMDADAAQHAERTYGNYETKPPVPADAANSPICPAISPKSI